MLKGKNLLCYKGLFRSATTACELRGSAALFVALNLSIQISEWCETSQGPHGGV